MAATAIIRSLISVAGNLPRKLHRLLDMSPTAPSLSYSTYYQIEDEVRQLCRRMKRIQALLTDLEEMEIWDSQIKLWLAELRDVAYDAENVLEEVDYDLQRYQLGCDVEAEQENQVGDPDHSTPPCPMLHDSSVLCEIIVKIKKISDRFDEMCKAKLTLQLPKEDGHSCKKQKVVDRPASSSVPGSSHVYGRDGDRDKVVRVLLSSQSLEHGDGKNYVSVISIVGMGGIGKTTLAQLVYNDSRVRDHFELRAWVCVSDNFDEVRLTKEILEGVTGRTTELQRLSPLQEKLQESVEGRRFLIVLDDLWIDSFTQWEAPWWPLSTGAEGSKVLITTRDEKVSMISGAIRMLRLKGLSEKYSWSLFAQFAFGSWNINDYPGLASIGKKIVLKCRGLPLAIKTLGSLLVNEFDEDRWNEILNSDIWELPTEGNDNLPALKLSYYHLPTPIKPCFAFCAVFQKYSSFSDEKLVQFWMAHGYLRPTTTRKCMEDVGKEYIQVLVQRSLLDKDGIKFRMHDLIHDLASSVCEGGWFTSADGKLTTNTLTRVRHLSLGCEADLKEVLACGSTDTFQHLRTLIQSPKYLSSDSKFSHIFLHLKYLRVLDLRATIVGELPDSVGNLKHLRYLSIDTLPNTIHTLPESLCDLLNLQTFSCIGAFVHTLPNGLRNLVNLRHLDLDCEHLSMMPRGIGRLTQLRTLSAFVVGEGVSAAEIGELRHLNDLQGNLKILIKSLSNWVYKGSNILYSKKGLKRLGLVFEDSEEQRRLQEELLELIQPHPNIEQIYMYNYIGRMLPRWMGDPSYLRLETLTLRNCKNCRHLPALGQLPLLKELTLRSIHGVRNVGQELLQDGRVVNRASPFLSLPGIRFPLPRELTPYTRHGVKKVGQERLGDGRAASRASPFPSLKRLILVDFSQLEEIALSTDGKAFPCLHVLKIRFCDRLKYVKLRLPALEQLCISGCEELTTVDYYALRVSQSRKLEVVHYKYIPSCGNLRLMVFSNLNFRASTRQQLPSPLCFGPDGATATLAIIQNCDSMAQKLLDWLLSRLPATSSSPSSYYRIKEEVENLRRTFEEIQNSLKDVAPQAEDSLQGEAYDAEDVMQDFEYALWRYGILPVETEEDQEDDPGHITPPYPIPPDASVQDEIAAKIRNINNRFKKIF